LRSRTVVRYFGGAEACGLDKQSELTDGVVAEVAQRVQARPWRRRRTHARPSTRIVSASRRGCAPSPLRLVRIHELLARDGVDVGYTTLRRFAHDELGWRERPPTVPIDDPPAGEEAQVDFGLMDHVVVDGTRRRLWAFFGGGGREVVRTLRAEGERTSATAGGERTTGGISVANLQSPLGKEPPVHMRFMALTALIGAALAASGCAAEETEGPSASSDEQLSGGFRPYAGFAKDTGTLLLRHGEDRGCTAARVGPRHILTAAHCVNGLGAGMYLSITQSPSEENADWSTVGVGRVWVHPSWAAVDLLCQVSLTCTRDHGAADVAVIEARRELPSTVTSARVGTHRYVAAGNARRVFITGYGCELGLGVGRPEVATLGAAVVPIEPVSSINRYGHVLSDLQKIPFDGTYMLTPGASHENAGASLCPGDSGGPVFLSRSAYPGGPAYPTNVVIGVNADYTFNGGEHSTFNVHTRLSNDAPHFVGAWLARILPESSFVRTLNP
jgi:hypothetical protein